LASDPANDVPEFRGTDINGVYAFNVHKNETYILSAQEASATPTFIPEYWDGAPTDPCGCGDEIDVDPAGVVDPVGPYNFTLKSIDDTIWFSIYGMTWDGNDYVGVTVTLEKLVSGGWTAVDSADTDAGGFVDLFGLGAGDYRMSFALSGTPVEVTAAEEPPCGCGVGIVYPLANGGLNALFSGITAASPGTGPQYVEVDLTFAQPTVPGGGGGSPGAPATPRGGHISNPFTPASFTSTSTPTPTPTPTPTFTPSPSSSPSSSPDASPTPTPGPSAGDTGFPWWIILIIVLVIGLVILVVVLVRRR
jgi:hypothetical protein